MAVTKLWSVTHSLKHVIDYANDPEKTSIKNFSEDQYQALADVLTYAKDEEKTDPAGSGSVWRTGGAGLRAEGCHERLAKH